MLLVSSADFYFKIYFFKKFFNEHFQSVKLFGSRHSVGPDLGPNCLQKLSAEDKVATSRRRINICCNMGKSVFGCKMIKL